MNENHEADQEAKALILKKLMIPTRERAKAEVHQHKVNVLAVKHQENLAQGKISDFLKIPRIS